MELEYSEKADTHRRNWGKHFLSSQTQSFSANFFLSGREQQHIVLPKPVFFLPKHKQVFLTENNRKNVQKWQKSAEKNAKPGSKQAKMIEKLAKCWIVKCWTCSVSALSSFLFLFCQTINFFPIKLSIFFLPSELIFPRGGKVPSSPPSYAYENR